MWPTVSPIYHEGRLGPEGLWLSGADWTTDSFGYMEGAIRSGQAASERIIEALQVLDS